MYMCAQIVIDSKLQYTVQVSYFYERRQYVEAERASKKALKMNIAGVVIGTIVWIIVIPSFVVVGLYRAGIIM